MGIIEDSYNAASVKEAAKFIYLPYPSISYATNGDSRDCYREIGRKKKSGSLAALFTCSLVAYKLNARRVQT
jgi:hypothetical protein